MFKFESLQSLISKPPELVHSSKAFSKPGAFTVVVAAATKVQLVNFLALLYF